MKQDPVAFSKAQLKFRQPLQGSPYLIFAFVLTRPLRSLGYPFNSSGWYSSQECSSQFSASKNYFSRAS